uniref:Uncharacterized protein n=1 Tax=Trichinella nativa TaxID=6335 RepID=A0A0V1KH51_9BILA
MYSETSPNYIKHSNNCEMKLWVLCYLSQRF